MATVYQTFGAAVKCDFDIDIKMNEQMHGFIERDEFNILCINPADVSTYVEKQGFKFMPTKKGRTVWTYWATYTDKWIRNDGERNLPKPLVIYQKGSNGVFCQGTYVFSVKNDKTSTYYYKKVSP